MSHQEELKILDASPSKIPDTQSIESQEVGTAKFNRHGSVIEEVKEGYKDVIEESIMRAEQILLAEESSLQVTAIKAEPPIEKKQNKKSPKGASFSFGEKTAIHQEKSGTPKGKPLKVKKTDTSESIQRDFNDNLMDSNNNINTQHALAKETPELDRKSSSIDTNELTDMDRKDDIPITLHPNEILSSINPTPNVISRNNSVAPTFNPTTATEEYQVQKNHSDNHFKSSIELKDSYKSNISGRESDMVGKYRLLQAENLNQRQMIERLQNQIKEKDQQMAEIRTYYQNQDNKKRFKGDRFISQKIIKGKQNLYKKENKDLDVVLPKIPLKQNDSPYIEKSHEKKKLNNQWSIGQINTHNKKLQHVGKRTRDRHNSEQSKIDKGSIDGSADYQYNTELPPIKYKGGNTPVRASDSDSNQPSQLLVKKSALQEKKQKFKTLENNFSKNKEKYALAKLEALKFKMQLQNKNLRLLTQQDDLMQNIYKDERQNYKAKPIPKRENKAYQNQQIIRIEKDLERTSKQLQNEISNLQQIDKSMLPESLLSEIDVMFDEAENYFAKKQDNILAHKSQIKKGYNSIQSKINTNLQQPDSQPETLQDPEEAQHDHYNPYDNGYQGEELHRLHQEREQRRRKDKEQYAQHNDSGEGEYLNSQKDRGGQGQGGHRRLSSRQGQGRSQLPKGASSKNKTPRKNYNSSPKQQQKGVLNYKNYNIDYLKNEDRQDIKEISSKYYLGQE